MVRCPNCGVSSIGAWDKLMCGLIGRRCWCEHCRQSSREERKQRLVTSGIFLVTLWLINRIEHPGYWLVAVVTWSVLLVAIEWRYICVIPLVPALDSERWKRTKDVFAWGFIALVLATFVFVGVLAST